MTALTILAAGGLTDVNFGLTLWTVVLFILFAVLMTKLGWRPLLNAIEEREKGIRGAMILSAALIEGVTFFALIVTILLAIKT